MKNFVLRTAAGRPGPGKISTSRLRAISRKIAIGFAFSWLLLSSWEVYAGNRLRPVSPALCRSALLRLLDNPHAITSASVFKRPATAPTRAVHEETLKKLRTFVPDAASARSMGQGTAGAQRMYFDHPQGARFGRVLAVVKEDSARQSALAEGLAFELSEILDLGLIPPTTPRRINGKQYSVQEYVVGDSLSDFRAMARDDISTRRQLPQVEQQRQVSAIVDFLTGDLLDGPKPEHKLVMERDAGAHLYSIDKGDAFGVDTTYSPERARQFAAFLEGRSGEVFRTHLKQRAGEMTQRVQKRYGPESARARAFGVRLEELLKTPKAAELPPIKSLADEIFDDLKDSIIRSAETGELKSHQQELEADIEKWFPQRQASDRNDELSRLLKGLLLRQEH